MPQRYSVNQYQINNVLYWVQEGEIAIPEIQRPFVWSSVKVRDLMDSLYQGYPIGYIIAWKNPDVRLKDGENIFLLSSRDLFLFRIIKHPGDPVL